MKYSGPVFLVKYVTKVVFHSPTPPLTPPARQMFDVAVVERDGRAKGGGGRH